MNSQGKGLRLLTTRKIDSNNRVSIPKQARKLLDLNVDDEVVFKYENNILTLEKAKKEKEREN